jgi:calcium-dependent protein kinase
MKPSNIMLQSPDPKAGIKVIDFGTAKKQVSGEK